LSELTAADARDRDGDDPLGALCERFVAAGDEPVYLDGNSLGRLPAATAQRLAEAVQSGWGSRLIRGWDEGWLELPLTVGDRLGELALGAGPGQVAIADSTTVCLYKLTGAGLAARPDRREIVTDRGNFPTDRYVLEGLADHARGRGARPVGPQP
jgi:kynureninase